MKSGSSLLNFGLVTTALFLCPLVVVSFVPLCNNNHRASSHLLHMATVPPSESATVGVVGQGFISVLIAKLAAEAGYKTWTVSTVGEEENTARLIDDSGEPPSNLEIIKGSDSDAIDARMRESDALMIAVDSEATMDEGVLKYLLSPDVALKLKRVVAMSRNLNGNGMGFFVKASKVAANKEVWDGSNANAYKGFEKLIKEKCAALDGVDYTIARAGTLKGGGCGDESSIDKEDEESSYYEKYLTNLFYEMTKTDIVTWQLLFDCNTRGVKLARGDVLPGPGVQAAFTATGTDEAPGDTSRGGLAEAMIRSLAIEGCANMDFGVGTAKGREPPSDAEWQQLFAGL